MYGGYPTFLDVECRAEAKYWRVVINREDCHLDNERNWSVSNELL